MDTDLVIIGAGAAGLGAAKTARWLGLSYVVVEGSHRIGGRAYTESPAPGVSFDLGAHWLHTARLNPLTQLLDAFEFDVTRNVWVPVAFSNGHWLNAEGYQDFEYEVFDRFQVLAEQGADIAAVDAYPRESKWTPMLDHMISLGFSTDSDSVSIRDFTDFQDTGKGQDWPVKQGYGTLLERFGSDVPVSLNCAVTEISCAGKGVLVRTKRGDLKAASAISTVSTGVLNAGDIRFSPALSPLKLEALQHLQLGNHNRIGLFFDANVFGDFDQETVIHLNGDDTPMYFEIRPFGLNYAVGSTGGRFADWLERAGEQASVECATEKLVDMFGSEVRSRLRKSIVTAWRGDHWVKGAYSATAPGAHGARRTLAEPENEKLFFAGEATSENFMDTLHGAFISGVRASLLVAQKLLKPGGVLPSCDELAWALCEPDSRLRSFKDWRSSAD